MLTDDLSPTDFPSALAACHGLGSHPFLLFESVAYDKLPAFDLGVLRIIADGVYGYCVKSNVCGVSVSRTLLIANERLMDLTRGTKFPNVSMFV